MAEAIAAFRGRELDDADLELADGSRLGLAVIDDAALGVLTDLDEPAVLLAEGWRPSGVASRERKVTQALAVQVFEAGASGLSWCSTLDSAWTNVTLFAERTIDRGVLRLDEVGASRCATHRSSPLPTIWPSRSRSDVVAAHPPEPDSAPA